MLNNLKNNQPFPSLKRTAQINSFYCGPASIQMLLSMYQIEINQEMLVSALNIQNKIRSHGMTIAEMGEFVSQFYPQLQFWFKSNATVSDLSQLINEYSIPVGVEWQGVFDYPDEESYDDEDDDPGHISIVTAIDTNDNYILIADPSQHYAGVDRKFSVLQFIRRWWDINEVIDPITNKRQEVDDYHCLFVITPKEDSSPEKLGLKRIQFLKK